MATKEDVLGNPAADGYVLTSTTAGVRSWTNLSNPVLHNDVSNSGTTAVIVEETLKTYTLPGGTLDTNGDVLMIVAAFTTAANANAKTIKLNFGATTCLTTGAIATNNHEYILRATITRITNTTQFVTAEIFCYEAAGAALVSTFTFGNQSSPAETLSADVDIKILGTNAVASANDIVCKSLMVYNLNK